MTKLLITLFETPPAPRPRDPTLGEAAVTDRWPALDRARRAKFDRVCVLATSRFAWERLLGITPEEAALIASALDGAHDSATGADEAEAAHETAHVDEAGAGETAADAPPVHADDASDDGAPAADAAPATAHVAEAEPTPAAAPAVAAPTGEATADSAPTADAAPATDGAAADAPVAAAAPATPAAPAPPKAAVRVPASREELIARLVVQQRSGRADHAAMDALGLQVAERFQLASVVCRLVPPPARERDHGAFVRMLAGLPEDGSHVTIDVSDGPRAAVGLAMLAAHGIARLRPSVTLDDVIIDRAQGTAVSGRHLLPSFRIHDLWADLAAGNAPLDLLDVIRVDPRLQTLTTPYLRFARAIDFGSPAEASRAARLLDDRRSHLKAPARAGLFEPADGALAAAAAPFHDDVPWSRRQLHMARTALRAGRTFMAALHVRETLLSAVLDAYGLGATRGKLAPTGDETHGDARVRPRDVAAFLIGGPVAHEKVPGLGDMWPWIGNPRTKFLLTSPVTVDPGVLRDSAQTLATIIDQVTKMLDDNAFKALVEAAPFDDVVRGALDSGAVRVHEVRRPKGDRRHDGRQGDQQEHHGESHPAGEQHAGGEGAPAGDAPPRGDARPPRGPGGGDRGPRPNDRGPRPNDRGPRPPRDGGPRGGDSRPPREISARAPAPRPRDRDDTPRPGSVPIGGDPRVTKTGVGLGNLAFALRAVGLVVSRPREEKPREEKPRDEKPRGDHPRGEHPPHDAPAAPAPAAPVAHDAPATPAPTHDHGHEPHHHHDTPPAAAAAPAFDVAGPDDAPPPA